MGLMETIGLTFSSSMTIGLVIATLIVLVFFIYNFMLKGDSWEKYGVKQVTMGSEGLTDFRLGCDNLINKHGDTVGFHTGDMILLTRDLDLLRQVMVKDFNKFVDRLIRISTNSPVLKGLFFLGGRDWKRIRQILSPSFSTGKIKMYSRSVDESAQKLSEVFQEAAKKDQLVPIKFVNGQYTSEIIAKLAFGLQIDCQGKEDDEFTRYLKSILKIQNKFMRVIMAILFRFKWLHRFLVTKLKVSLVDNIDTNADVYFKSVLRTTVAERQEYARTGKRKFTDLLQTLVTAKEEGDKVVAGQAVGGATGGVVAAENDDEATEHELPKDLVPKTMTDEELIGQAMFVIFAAFETTATTLQMCFLMLAKHPDIQEKVYQEIQRVVKSDTPTYEELGQLKYTTQFIDETLRMFPPAPIMSRKALETTKIGDNITVPKGAYVIIPLETIMKDPKHFPNPEKFDPDRFSDETKAHRDPMAFLPFGYGPRICIGMRLAYLELRLALVHVLRKVKFELNQRTEPKPGRNVKTRFQGVIVVDQPIMLALKLREAK